MATRIEPFTWTPVTVPADGAEITSVTGNKFRVANNPDGTDAVTSGDNGIYATGVTQVYVWTNVTQGDEIVVTSNFFVARREGGSSSGNNPTPPVDIGPLTTRVTNLERQAWKSGGRYTLTASGPFIQLGTQPNTAGYMEFGITSNNTFTRLGGIGRNTSANQDIGIFGKNSDNQKFIFFNLPGGIEFQNSVQVIGNNTLSVGGVNVGAKLTELEASLANKVSFGVNNAANNNSGNPWIDLNSNTNTASIIRFSSNGVTLGSIGKADIWDPGIKIVGNATHPDTVDQVFAIRDFRGGIRLNNKVNVIQSDLEITGSGNLIVGNVNVIDKINENAAAVATKANTNDVYTKTEVDEKIRAASHYKGVVATRADLPMDGNTAGDIRIIADENNLMVAWDGTSWDDLSNVDVDLSDYLSKTEFATQKAGLETQIDGKADKTAVNTLATSFEFLLNNQLSLVEDQMVKLTGDQDIAGVKTFTSSPVIPTPTTDAQAATKQYVDTAVASVDLSEVEGKIAALETTAQEHTTTLGQHTDTIDEHTTAIETLENAQVNALVKGTNEFTGGGSLINLKMTGGNDTGYLAFTVTNTTLYEIGRVYANGNYNLLFKGNSTSDNTAQQKAVFAGFRGGVDIQTDLMITGGGALTVGGVNVMDKINANTTAVATKANADNVYTKAEVDEKIRAASHYKGVVATRADLPMNGNTTGDIRIIADENNLMVAWNGTSWDDLSNVDVDLSDYLSKTEFATEKTTLQAAIDEKVDTTTYTTEVAAINTSLDSKVDQTVYDARVTTVDNRLNNAIYKGTNQMNNGLIFNSGNGGQNWIELMTNNVSLLRLGRNGTGHFNIVIQGGTNSALNSQALNINNFKGGFNVNTNMTVASGKTLTVNGVNVVSKITELETKIAALTARLEAVENGNNP